MRSTFAFCLLTFAFCLSGQDMHSKRARDLHRRTIVIDLHSDTTQRLLDEKMDLGKRQPDGHMDLPRMREGGLGAGRFGQILR